MVRKELETFEKANKLPLLVSKHPDPVLRDSQETNVDPARRRRRPVPDRKRALPRHHHNPSTITETVHHHLACADAIFIASGPWVSKSNRRPASPWPSPFGPGKPSQIDCSESIAVALVDQVICRARHRDGEPKLATVETMHGMESRNWCHCQVTRSIVETLTPRCYGRPPRKTL